MLLGICAASDVGGVQETEVEELLVQIVPVASPKEYVMVCVKDVEARVTVIVPAEPIVVAGIEIEDFRGIVRRVTVWLPLTLHPLPPLPSKVKHWKLALIDTDLVPSALPAILPDDHGAPEYPDAAITGYPVPCDPMVQLWEPSAELKVTTVLPLMERVPLG